MSRKNYTRIHKRRRGTAIVETEKGIIVTAGRNKVFLLPGGKANKRETRTIASIRELLEETGLQPYYIKYLFHHVGTIHFNGHYRDHHTVCLIKARGTPHPHHEIKYIEYYRANSNIHISTDTKEIIQRYYEYKKKSRIKREFFHFINRIREWLVF
ncbi:MAG: NUDIX domain-containing protein [Dehalococcoidales bacterium]